MKNSKMPASPIWQEGMDVGEDAGAGLTKLEHFSGLAMQALISANRTSPLMWSDTAAEAVIMARALLKRLEADE